MIGRRAPSARPQTPPATRTHPRFRRRFRHCQLRAPTTTEDRTAPTAHPRSRRRSTSRTHHPNQIHRTKPFAPGPSPRPEPSPAMVRAAGDASYLSQLNECQLVELIKRCWCPSHHLHHLHHLHPLHHPHHPTRPHPRPRPRRRHRLDGVSSTPLAAGTSP